MRAYLGRVCFEDLNESRVWLVYSRKKYFRYGCALGTMAGRGEERQPVAVA